MKTYLSILAATLVTMACNTPQGATSKASTDDIYYSSKDVAMDKEREAQQIAKESKAKELAAKKATEAANNAKEAKTSDDDYYNPSDKAATTPSSTTNRTAQSSAFNYDDYYDYGYAVRLRRFHSNIPSYGYYDNYYTNSYWYTGNPYNYGTSIYMGYNFWGPSYISYAYNPSFYWRNTWGMGYDPFYNPYAYMGYNPYMNSYMNGYYDGFYHGYYPHYSNNYFNSYDKNSYYGPRNSSNNTRNESMGDRYMSAVEKETNRPFSETKGRDSNPFIRTQGINANEPRDNSNIHDEDRGKARPNNSGQKGGTPINSDPRPARPNIHDEDRGGSRPGSNNPNNNGSNAPVNPNPRPTNDAQPTRPNMHDENRGGRNRDFQMERNEQRAPNFETPSNQNNSQPRNDSGSRPRGRG
ncbi:MAG: hypothetical protein ABI315_12890 [Bacteroidia bacterium]